MLGRAVGGSRQISTLPSALKPALAHRFVTGEVPCSPPTRAAVLDVVDPAEGHVVVVPATK